MLGSYSPSFIQKMNLAALDVYRQGWAIGDASVITSQSPSSFEFTWMPQNRTVSKKEFSDFFTEFRTAVEENGRSAYEMRFANIIHRTVSVL